MRRPAPRWLGGLQPATHGGLVVQVLGTESSFQILLFSRYDDVMDERHRCNERGEQPQAVDPNRDPELEHRERQIDRVPAEAIGARPDDRGGWLSGGYRRAGGPEFRHRVREQHYCHGDESRSERHRERPRKEWEWRGELSHRACNE